MQKKRMIDEEYTRSMIIGCEDDMELPQKHMIYVHLICETLGKPTIITRCNLRKVELITAY